MSVCFKIFTADSKAITFISNSSLRDSYKHNGISGNFKTSTLSEKFSERECCAFSIYFIHLSFPANRKQHCENLTNANTLAEIQTKLKNG